MIQRREERAEPRCPHEAGGINGSGVRGRRVREDVRVKEEWPDPGGRQRRGCSEANIKLWRSNNRRLSPVLITARRDQGDRAHVVSAIASRECAHAIAARR